MAAAKKTATKTPKIKFSSLKAGDKINVNINYSDRSNSHEATVVCALSGQTYLYLDKAVDRADFSTGYFYGNAHGAAKNMGLKANNKRSVIVYGNPASIEITSIVKPAKSMIKDLPDEALEEDVDWYAEDEDGEDDEDYIPAPKEKKRVAVGAKKAAVKATVKKVNQLKFSQLAVGDRVMVEVSGNKFSLPKTVTAIVIEADFDTILYADTEVDFSRNGGPKSTVVDDGFARAAYEYELNMKAKRQLIVKPGTDTEKCFKLISKLDTKKPFVSEVPFNKCKIGDRVNFTVFELGGKEKAHTGTVIRTDVGSVEIYSDKKIKNNNFEGYESEFFYEYDDDLDTIIDLGLDPTLKRKWVIDPFEPGGVVSFIDKITPGTPPKKRAKIKYNDFKKGDRVELVIRDVNRDVKVTGTVLESAKGYAEFYLDKTFSGQNDGTDSFYDPGVTVHCSPDDKYLQDVCDELKLNHKLARLWSTNLDTATIAINKIEPKTNAKTKESEVAPSPVLKDLKESYLKPGDKIKVRVGRQQKEFNAVFINSKRIYLDGEYKDNINYSFDGDESTLTDEDIKLIDKLGLDKNKKQFWNIEDSWSRTNVVSPGVSNTESVNGDVYGGKWSDSIFNDSFVEDYKKIVADMQAIKIGTVDLNTLWDLEKPMKITHEHIKVGDKVLLNIHDSKTGLDAKVKAYVTRSTSESIDFLLEKEFSNTLLASWSIKDHQRDTAKTFGFEPNKKVGWHINEKTKYTSIESILHKDDASFSTKPITAEIPRITLNEGDYIEFELNYNGTTQTERGTVLYRSGIGIDVFCDRSFMCDQSIRSTTAVSPRNIDTHKKLGLLFATSNRQFTIMHDNENTRVTKVTKAMTTKISYVGLKKGDKVSIEVEDNGTIKRTATVLGLDGESAILYLDGGPLITSRTLGKSWNPHDAGFENAAKDLGLDANAKCCWRYKDTSAFTKVTAINDLTIPLDTLNPGDFIEFELVKNGFTTEKHKARVVGEYDGMKLIAFDKQYIGMCGESWASSGSPRKGVQDAVKEFGIPQDSKVLFRAYNYEFFVKKVTKAPPVPIGSVKVGDKIRATIKDKASVVVDGTVFYSDSTVAYIYVDEKDLDKVPEAWVPAVQISSNVLNNVKALGFNINLKRAYKVSKSHGDTIDRVISKSTALLNEALCVGDRILVTVDGVEARATVIQEKAPFKAIVLAFDNPVVSNGTTVSGQLLTGFTATAKSFGHTTDVVHGMNLDTRHKIIQRITSPPISDAVTVPATKPETKTETKPIEKKEIKMTAQVNFMDRVKEDMEAAGYRVASTQFTNAIKQGILLVFKDKGFDDSKLSVVKEILESEFGTALVATVLGYGLTYIPNLKDDPRIKRLAGEFRISGMATVGNEVMGIATSYFLPAVTQAMSMLPPVETAVPTTMVKKTPAKVTKTKKRIVATPISTPVEENHSEETPLQMASA